MSWLRYFGGVIGRTLADDQPTVEQPHAHSALTGVDEPERHPHWHRHAPDQPKHLHFHAHAKEYRP